jgi:hypothetical protein
MTVPRHARKPERRVIVNGAWLSVFRHWLRLGLLVLPFVLSPESPRAQTGERERCLALAKKDKLNCWSSCPSGETRARSCVSTCNDTFDVSKSQCSQVSSSRLEGSRSGAGGGANGCYFGECPEDLKKRIDSKREETEAKPKPRTRTRAKPDPEPEDEPQIATTSICQTPGFWCTMNVRGAVGSSCWCVTPVGSSTGITVPQR